MQRDFQELVQSLQPADPLRQIKAVTVGLDSDYEKIPAHKKKWNVAKNMFNFNMDIFEGTKNIAGAYKLNFAFYLSQGIPGIQALKRTIKYIQKNAPGVLIIVDCKIADIDNTNAHYGKFFFDELLADAITVHSYMGSTAMSPLLKRKDKGFFVLGVTSGQGREELQDTKVGPNLAYYEFVSQTVADRWNVLGNCGLVTGAPYPDAISKVRTVAPNLSFLLPGVGAQEGDLEKAASAGFKKDGTGIFVNASRSIIFASNGPDFVYKATAETKRMDTVINIARKSFLLQTA